MNDVAYKLAREMLYHDREDYLNEEPAPGVVLEVLPLCEDSVFHALEVRRAILKMSDVEEHLHALTQRQIHEVEERLNNRAAELAVAQQNEDLSKLAPAPHGVPVALLKAHEHDSFVALLPAYREAKALHNKLG
uniref:DUF7623 domain-containing protein n=1 Tax=Lygus hesperus TaxID=30085 RepID=A0A0A9YBZ9_LYGHE